MDFAHKSAPNTLGITTEFITACLEILDSAFIIMQWISYKFPASVLWAEQNLQAAPLSQNQQFSEEEKLQETPCTLQSIEITHREAWEAANHWFSNAKLSLISLLSPSSAHNQLHLPYQQSWWKGTRAAPALSLLVLIKLSYKARLNSPMTALATAPICTGSLLLPPAWKTSSSSGTGTQEKARARAARFPRGYLQAS